MKDKITPWPHRWPPAPDERFGTVIFVRSEKAYHRAIVAWLRTSPVWKKARKDAIAYGGSLVLTIDKLAFQENCRVRAGKAWEPAQSGWDSPPVPEGTLTKKKLNAYGAAYVREQTLSCLWSTRNMIYEGDYAGAITNAFEAGRLSQRELAATGEKLLAGKTNSFEKKKLNTAHEHVKIRQRAAELRAASRLTLSDLQCARKIHDERAKSGNRALSVERLRKIISGK